MSRFRAAALFAIASLLSGCSDADWDHLLSFSSPDNTSSQTVVADTSPAYTSASPPVQSAEIAPPPAQQASAAPRPTYSTPTTVTTTAPEPVTSPPVQRVAAAAQPTYSVTTTVTTARVDPTMSYCHMVAQGSGSVATRDGYDNADQQNAADATYRACMAVYGQADR